MISITFIALSICLITSGNMPLLGGKRARGNLVRIGGGIILCLSILTMLVPSNVSMILLLLICCLLAVPYFFVKGDEPTEDEAKNYGFRSSKDEIKTYGEAAKGLAAFFIVLGVIFGSVFILLKILR